jgi:hypothetical protein
MKPLMLLGVVLAVLGGVVLARGLTYTKNKSVLEVAGLKASIEEKRSIPTWAGVVGLVAGVALIVAGAGKRRS